MSRSAVIDRDKDGTGWPSDGLYVETDCNVTTLDHWEHAPETEDGPLDEVLKECGEFE
jgi:hypothetical protein